MRVIGITGSSGAGKTTLCKILKEKYGASVIDADRIAKKLARKGTTYLQAIVEQFGQDILDSNGELKRKELADLIYNDTEKRNILNRLTFRYVVEEIKISLAKIKNAQTVVIDAPLLFESNLNKICDKVIGVIATEEEKIRRICNRDNITKTTAKKRLDIQKNNEYIQEKSDFIIYNNGSMEKLEEEIRKIEWL